MDVRVEVDEELGRVLNTWSRAEKETQAAAMAEAEAEIGTTWAVSLASHAGTALEQRLLVDGAHADVGPASFTLVAGVGGPVSGGLGSGPRDWSAAEYGMTPQQIVAPNRRKATMLGGRPFSAATTIWVGKNLKPRNPRGYVAMPTVRERGPQYVAAWVRGLMSVLRGAPVEIQKD